MLRIENVKTAGQLKTFFKFATSNIDSIEDRLLKIFLKDTLRQPTPTSKLKMWLSYAENKCTGRIAALKVGPGLGYVSCFASQGAFDEPKALLNLAVKFLEQEGVQEIRGPGFPRPYLSKGIRNSDHLGKEFWDLGFLPLEDLREGEENLSTLLKKHQADQQLVAAPYRAQVWGAAQWDQEIASACAVYNQIHGAQSYLVETALEETLRAHGPAHALIGLTVYEDHRPVAFLVTLNIFEGLPRFPNFPKFFKRKIVKELKLIFLEILSTDKKSAAKIQTLLWNQLGQMVQQSNRPSEDPLVTFPTTDTKSSVHKIVFSKFLKTA